MRSCKDCFISDQGVRRIVVAGITANPSRFSADWVEKLTAALRFIKFSVRVPGVEAGEDSALTARRVSIGFDRVLDRVHR
jgi:hypothetical protein